MKITWADFRCWLQHRRYHTIVVPGVLPWPLDFFEGYAVSWCPICKRNGGGRGRQPVGLRAGARA